jgi:porin
LELHYLPDPDGPESLPTTYKLGAWYHSGRFADRLFDNRGNSLASPLSSGIAESHRGDYAIYGVVDQALWRRDGTKDQGISAFLQIQAAPADRNLSNLFIDGGFNWNAPFADRPDDMAGIAFAYLGISKAARQFSSDLVTFGLASFPYASSETVIEATYKAHVTDWLTLQPDAQYVVNPNAHIPGQFGAKRLPDALIVGLRATVSLSAP